MGTLRGGWLFFILQVQRRLVCDAHCSVRCVPKAGALSYLMQTGEVPSEEHVMGQGPTKNSFLTLGMYDDYLFRVKNEADPHGFGMFTDSGSAAVPKGSRKFHVMGVSLWSDSEASKAGWGSPVKHPLACREVESGQHARLADHDKAALAYAGLELHKMRLFGGDGCDCADMERTKACRIEDRGYYRDW